MPDNKINRFIALFKEYFKVYIGIIICIFLFILFFQPFSTDRFSFENKLLYVAGFGLIIFLVFLSAQIGFQKVLIQHEDDQYENTFLVFIYNLSMVAANSVAFAFYIRFVGQNSITFFIVLKIISICVSVPIVLHIKKTIESTRVKYKRLLHENREMTDKLKQFSENYSNKYIELISENESDNFQIQISAIVYLKSADNYVEVGFKEGNEIKKKLIRNTLKTIEQLLKEYNNFIRTHRTGIVNLQYVERLNKNFNTYWLSLSNTQETVPVARQYLMVIKDLL